MYLRHLRFVSQIFGVVALFWGAPAQADARRVALVIGNANYLAGSLVAPANDALLIANALRQVHFEVIPAPDAALTDFQKALGAFRARARGAEVALIYYAGHGIERGGKNYLLPTDAELLDPYDLGGQAIDLDRVTEATEGAKLRVVILDACRNNPFGRSWTLAHRAAATRGLAQVQVDDVMVIYAAAPGEVANDRAPGVPGGDKDSPFALSLAKRLVQPGLPVQLLGGAVRDDVLAMTQDLPRPFVPQRPFVTASVTGEPIYLISAVQRSEAMPPASIAPPVPVAANVATPAGKLVADCEALAGLQVKFEDILSLLAVPACTRAASGVPGNARVLTFLGRALDSQGDFVSARSNYERAAAKGEPAAMNNLGLLFSTGSGVPADYARARQLFEQAAALGEPRAMANLGAVYGTGKGVPTDYLKARQWYEQAASRGIEFAMHNLGILYFNGLGVPQDYRKAYEYFEIAAGKGDRKAMGSLGVMYRDGLGVAQDFAKARAWFEKAAAKGETDAMTSLGYLYGTGQGVAIDRAKERQWYEQAAEKGNAVAMKNLGILYKDGLGVPQDFGKARTWFEQAAAKDDIAAMTSLGVLDATGKGGAVDYVKARQWYERAAAKGDGLAMNNLALLYKDGLGVAQDYGVARSWFEKAAAAGSAGAMTNLGYLYGTGKGVALDFAQARQWYEQAAAKGESTAMKNLGVVYRDGLGVPKDLATSRQWFEKAAALGEADAKAWLASNPR